MKISRRSFAIALGSLGASTVGLSLSAKEPGFTEPIHRVAATAAPAPALAKPHPLDRALSMARRGLQGCKQSVTDYTAILVKRERVDGTLLPNEYMMAKIRNRKLDAAGNVTQPMSVYLHFLKPSTIQGREVIYVEGKHENKVVAHEGGFKGKFLPTVHLAPNSSLAMRGQRYPMTEIGIENLMVKLIERGETAKKQKDVQVEVRHNARIKDRVCTVLQVIHPTKHEGLVFHKAQIFLDDELNLPIRYVAYDWPKREGASQQVLEEYTYLNLKTNVGLKDTDFDPYNEKYNFY